VHRHLGARDRRGRAGEPALELVGIPDARQQNTPGEAAGAIAASP
jgi:hypothetical protein